MNVRPPLDPSRFWFDTEAADLACDFFTDYLTHTKGVWRGNPFILDPWQSENIIRPLFGWKNRDGSGQDGTGPDATRANRTAYIEIPRKAGKSSLGAGIGLYMLFIDREPAAEVLSAAADREQAAIIFEMAKTMVLANPMLRKRAEIYRRSIVVPSTGSSYKVLSADADTKHGSSPSCILFDELHAQSGRALFDALTTGTGARRQPLLIAVTTAGFNRHSLCYEQHDYAIKVRDGIVDDPTFLPVIYAADEEDNWADPKIWAKAHPGLGTSVQYSFLEAEARKAKETPAFENTFRRLYLNQWTQQDVRWMPMEKWDACNQHPVTIEDMAGRVCYAGLDLASTTDLAALVLLFPPLDEEDHWQVLPYYWVPQENVALRARRDKVDYESWIKSGHIIPTEGNVIDQEAIRIAIVGPKLSSEDTPARIEDRRQQLVRWHLPPEGLGNIVQIKELAIDRWNSTQLQTQLLGDGQLVVQFGQGFASMSAPTKELMGLVLSKKLNHGGHPVLRWNASNAAVKQDAAGNAKIDKEKSTERVDGLVSLVMALGRASLQAVELPSVYEERGVVSI